MNKLLVACAILAPLVGCTGMVGNGSDQFGNGGASANGAGASGTTQSGGSASSSSAGNSSAGNSSAGSSSSAGAGIGAGGTNGGGGASAIGGTSSGGACTVDALPSGVQAMLNNQCSTCHGATPLAGLPSLTSYANLTAPSKTDPSKTNAVLALARIQSATLPMPPAPGARVTAADISNLQAFIAAGYPKQTCATGAGGGGGAAGGSTGGMGGTGGAAADDPLYAMPTCTSMTSWKNGNQGSASMNPGMACVSCHSMGGEGPRFSIAGTVYPTGHEPDRCNSKVGTAGATVVIIGADGKQLTLTPNGVGNFTSTTSVKTPFQAKVTYQGRERLMLTPQSNGDCNACHSQNGSMMAPGRITIP